MTLKKKKKKELFRSGGFLRSVGRGQSNNLFFLALGLGLGMCVGMELFPVILTSS